MTRRFEANVYKGLPGDEDRGGSPTPEQEKRTIKVGDWVNIETGPSDGWVVGGYPEEEGMVFLEHPATGMTRTMPLSSVRVSEAPQGEVKKERVLLPADVKDVLDMEVEELLSPHTFDFDKTEPVSEDAFRELNRRRAAELTERLRRNFLDFEFPDLKGVMQIWQPDEVQATDRTDEVHEPVFLITMKRKDGDTIRRRTVTLETFLRNIKSFRKPEDITQEFGMG
jgi:hypothetical protein